MPDQLDYTKVGIKWTDIISEYKSGQKLSQLKQKMYGNKLLNILIPVITEYMYIYIHISSES